MKPGVGNAPDRMFAKGSPRMVHKFTLPAASALAFALSACGSPAEEADDPTTIADEVELPQIPATPVTADLDGEESDATDQAPAVASTPTPAASPTTAAARPAAAATSAAAAAPPMWAVCSACHAVAPGEHGIGPSLAGVFGTKAGAKAGFAYSDAMKSSGLTWNQATLDRYLTDPRGVVPGTTMAYAGLKNDAQRAAVIDYLKSL